MGRRVAVNSTTVSDLQHITPVTVKRNIRKRKLVGSAKTPTKAARTNSNSNDNWHENADDEDSSSNDTVDQIPVRNLSSKHANHSSILLNSTLNASISSVQISPSINESPKPVYVLRPSMVNGTILSDLGQRPWRLGKPIGKGNFGEIFLASNNITVPVTNENAKYVVKIEPHSNGPLFVEIHCLMNTAKKNCLSTPSIPNAIAPAPAPDSLNNADDNILQVAPSGIPNYIASGSHHFGDARYRFLVLQRFDRDLHSLIKNTRVSQKSVLTLALHILTVLENLHNNGYCHNDVKAQNLMISKCTFYKEKLSKTKSNGMGNAFAAATRQNHHMANSRTRNKISSYGHKDYQYEEKQQTTDSGNSSEQEMQDDDDDEEFVIKRESTRGRRPLRDEDFIYDDDEDEDNDDEEDDEDFDDGATTNSNNTNSMDCYRTPVNKRLNKRRSSRNIVQFSGSNPVRSCRRGDKPNAAVYDEMVKSHYLRPAKRISYSEFFNEDDVPLKNDSDKTRSNSVSSDDESEEFIPGYRRSTSARKSSSPSKRKRSSRRQQQNNQTTKTNYQENHRSTRRCRTRNNSHHSNGHEADPEDDCSQDEKQFVLTEEERIFLIDYGLASKFMDRGIHRPFIMDQRRAHDGTLEFTSRDAHMGAHSRRSDLECLGYNLIYWSQGYLPWKEAAQQQQQEKVHQAKELLMTDVREMLKQIYGKQVPKYLGDFLHLVNELAFHEKPNYDRYRKIFKREYEMLGYDSREMTLDSQEILLTSVRIKEDADQKCDIFELNKHNALAWSALKNCSASTPFQENSNGISRISPKNLRSKSDKKTMKKKKFCWAEILSQDPDQIARERAEKEFTREEESNDVQQRTVRRYEGKPTYAILEIQKRLIECGKWVDYDDDSNGIKTEKSIKKGLKIENDDVPEYNENEDEQEEEPVEDDEIEQDDNEDEDDEEEDEESDQEFDGEAEEDSEENVEDEEEEMSEINEDTVDSNASSFKTQRKRRGGRPRKLTTKSPRTTAVKRKKSSSSSTTSRSTNSRRNRRATSSPSSRSKKNKSSKVTFNTKTRSRTYQTKSSRTSATKSTIPLSQTSTTSTSSSSSSSSSLSSSNSTTQHTLKNANQNNNNYNSNKRGGATKYGRKASASSLSQAIAASAAGEVEHNGHNNHHFADDQNSNDNSDKPLSQRRTRRCLLKTEKAMRNAVLVDQEDSNSNFSPDMRNLYLNNNENMYYKSSLVAAAAAKNYRK